MIVLLVIGNGREKCLRETIASAQLHLDGTITQRVLFDDTGDADYRSMLRSTYGPQGFEVIDGGPPRGFGGAIRCAWDWLKRHSDEPFVFHLEEDFTFTRDVDLDTMADCLAVHRHVLQLVLKRQPWNPQERAAGGIIEQHSDDYEQRIDGPWAWVEHRRFWSTNPHLTTRRLVTTQTWPDGAESEGRFTHDLLSREHHNVPSAELRFAFWGHREDPHWVTHIGDERTGFGY